MTGKQDSHPEPASSGKLFAATRWSLVLRAKDNSPEALNTLFTTYRRPLVVFAGAARFKLDAASDEEDLVQGFFAHLLRRDFLADVDKQQGSFRAFLLRRFKN